MRLLLFSDLHCDVEAARRLVEQSHTVNVVVGAGDFGNLRQDVGMCVDVLKAIDRPTILVPGNNESKEQLSQACHSWPQAHVLHGSGVTVAGVSFFGLGGGVPVTPFGTWSYDFTEEQATELLRDCPPGCVLVSHSPPKGAVDRDGRGRSLGSAAVHDVVVHKQPKLVVCGHIHASAGQQAMIGETVIVNAGPDGIEWEVQQ